MTATQFVTEVKQRHPRVALASSEVAVARAEVRAARQWDNPTLAYEREEVSGAGIVENTFTAALPLDLSQARGRRARSAEQGVNAAESDVESLRQTLAAHALRTYARAAAARESVELLEATRASLLSLRDVIRARAAAGDASEYDVVRVEIELSAADDMLRGARADRKQWQLELGVLAGRPGQEIAATDPMSRVASTPKTPAAEEHPLVQASRYRVAQQELARDAAKWGWVPDVTVSGGPKSAEGPDSITWGYVAGVAISVPILDRGRAGRARARAELRRAHAQLAVVERETRGLAATTQEAFRQARQRHHAFETGQLQRIEQLKRVADVSYQAGERSIFELIDAHRTDREARLHLTHLKLEETLALIDWLAAHGSVTGDDE